MTVRLDTFLIGAVIKSKFYISLSLISSNEYFLNHKIRAGIE